MNKEKQKEKILVYLIHLRDMGIKNIDDIIKIISEDRVLNWL